MMPLRLGWARYHAKCAGKARSCHTRHASVARIRRRVDLIMVMETCLVSAQVLTYVR